MTTPTTAPAWVTKLKSLLIQGASVAAFISGTLTAVNGNIPRYESAILSAVGAGVFVVERYWADIKKAL